MQKQTKQNRGWCFRQPLLKVVTLALVGVFSNNLKAQEVRLREVSTNKIVEKQREGNSMLKLKIKGCDTCQFSVQTHQGKKSDFPILSQHLKDTLFVSVPNEKLIITIDCKGKSTRFYNVSKANKTETMIVDFNPKQTTDSTVKNK